MTGTCVKCKTPFRYEYRGGKRIVCDKCQREALRLALERRRDSQRKLDTEYGGRELESNGTAVLRHADMARLVGVTPSRIKQIERDALAKIRNHPEAKRLFKFWKEEGCPTAPLEADPSEKLLDWHLNLAELWGVYEDMFARGYSAEAVQCREEIASFFKTLRKAILELRPTDFQWLRDLTE